jgi:hypothetical protein
MVVETFFATVSARLYRTQWHGFLSAAAILALALALGLQTQRLSNQRRPVLDGLFRTLSFKTTGRANGECARPESFLLNETHKMRPTIAVSRVRRCHVRSGMVEAGEESDFIDRIIIEQDQRKLQQQSNCVDSCQSIDSSRIWQSRDAGKSVR